MSGRSSVLHHLYIRTSASVLSVTAAALIYLAIIPGCTTRDGLSPRTLTELLLSRVCGVVESARKMDRPPPPTRLCDFVEWGRYHSLLNDKPYGGIIDGESATILDAWGRPIVLIVKSDEVVGAGSKGPDGIWQDGHGDDVIRLVDNG